MTFMWNRNIILIWFFFPTAILGQMPCYKDPDQAFANKVGRLFSTHKDAILTMEKKEKIYSSISLLDEQAPYEKVIKYLHTLYKVWGEDIPLSDTEKIILFLKIAVPIIEQYKKHLFDTIEVLELSKWYWETLQFHPIRYVKTFPLKRFIITPSADIAYRIEGLQNRLNRELMHLGKLFLHLDQFDAIETDQDRLIWLCNLCKKIIKTYPNSYSIAGDISYPYLLRLMTVTAKCSCNYRIAVEMGLEPFLMPGRLQKNWVNALLGGLFCLYSAKLGYKNRVMLKENATKYWQGVKKKTAEYIQDRKQEIDNVLFGGDQEEFKQRENRVAADREQLKKDYATVLLDLYNRLNFEESLSKDNNKKEIPPLKKGDIDKIFRFNEKIMDFAKGKGVAHPQYKQLSDKEKKDLFNPDEIRKRANDLDGDYLLRVIWPIITALISEEGRITVIDGQKLVYAVDRCQISGVIDLEGIGTFATVMKKGGASITKDIVPLVDTLTQLLDSLQLSSRVGILKMEEGMMEIQKKLFLNQKVNLAIISIIPGLLVLGVGGKLAYALYKKMKGVASFDSVRNVLLDIATLLNSYNEEHSLQMTLRDYGHLLYLVYRLEFENNIIPKQYRALFMQDASALKSSALSIQQKYEMVTNIMFKRYPFLTHSYQVPRAK